LSYQNSLNQDLETCHDFVPDVLYHPQNFLLLSHFLKKK
jgi:hypothetical protein